MKLPVPRKPQPTPMISTFHPGRTMVKNKIRALYHHLGSVFINISPSAWSIGDSSWREFIRVLATTPNKEVGFITVRGGMVFYNQTVITTCDNPKPDDVLCFVRIWISESTRVYVRHEEYY